MRLFPPLCSKRSQPHRCHGPFSTTPLFQTRSMRILHLFLRHLTKFHSVEILSPFTTKPQQHSHSNTNTNTRRASQPRRTLPPLGAPAQLRIRTRLHRCNPPSRTFPRTQPSATPTTLPSQPHAPRHPLFEITLGGKTVNQNSLRAVFVRVKPPRRRRGRGCWSRRGVGPRDGGTAGGEGTGGAGADVHGG